MLDLLGVECSLHGTILNMKLSLGPRSWIEGNPV